MECCSIKCTFVNLFRALQTNRCDEVKQWQKCTFFEFTAWQSVLVKHHWWSPFWCSKIANKKPRPLATLWSAKRHPSGYCNNVWACVRLTHWLTAFSLTLSIRCMYWWFSSSVSVSSSESSRCSQYYIPLGEKRKKCEKNKTKLACNTNEPIHSFDFVHQSPYSSFSNRPVEKCTRWNHRNSFPIKFYSGKLVI